MEDTNNQLKSESNVDLITDFNDTTVFENLSNELKGPLSAYFNKRVSDSAKYFFKKHTESDSESSVGLFDVENISLFDEAEENENFRLSDNPMAQLNMDTTVKSNYKEDSVASKSSTESPETDLNKQRILAQKALKQVNKNSNESQLDFCLTPEESRQRKAYSEIPKQGLTFGNLQRSRYKSMFQPNCSPETPKVFSDELSSVNGEDSDMKNETKPHENSSTTQSEYFKNINSIFRNSLKITPDVEFEFQNKEDVIKKLEEDEKQFKMETSGVMHNSKISHFSDVHNEDVPIKWSTGNLQTEEPANILLSIEQYFNKRSNRISSLVGSTSDDISPLNLQSESEQNNTPGDDLPVKSLDIPSMDKNKLRRCASSYDVKNKSEVPKSIRSSIDSTRDTVVIQNILAEMESGLSSTEICEKLLNFRINKRSRNLKSAEKEKKPVTLKEMENNETPKSSRKKETLGDSNKISNKEEPRGSLRVKDFRKLMSPRSLSSPNLDFKENNPRLDLKKNFSTKAENDKIQKLKGRNGFDSSTPKLQVQKSQNNKFKTACSKLRLDSEDWEAPRVNAIQPAIALFRSDSNDENDKTIMIESTILIPETSKLNNTITINDTLTVEDTIIAGDLTVLNQRLKEMKDDSVCIVRPSKSKEPDLLTIVQKLAAFPKGSVNCSALTTLIRDQFPELLSSVLEPSLDTSLNKTTVPPSPTKQQLNFQANPDEWVKFPKHIGFDEKIFSCPDVEKTIFISIENISKQWLLISLSGMKIFKQENGKNLNGVKHNDKWSVGDFVTVYMKDTVVPPDSYQTLQVFFTSSVATDLDLKLRFSLKNLISEESQEKCLGVKTYIINPLDHFNVLPNDIINFGIIAGQCHDVRIMQLSFDGICKLPITVYIEQDETQAQHFDLIPCLEQSTQKGEWNGNKFDYVFEKGEKQTLEVKVVFLPKININEEKKCQHLKATLVIKIKSKTNLNAVLEEIRLKGSVGFAKFVCNPACNPFVFRVVKGQSLTRLFPLKNVGNLPLALTFTVLDEDRKNEVDDDIFIVPKTFYLSNNEEAGFEVTFKGNTSNSCTKRFMLIQIQPNGRIRYEIELIGKISSSDGSTIPLRPLASASTKSTKSTTSQSFPCKIQSTSPTVSWESVSLEKKLKESVQIKIKASAPTYIRFSFLTNNKTFQLENDFGDEVDKMRKLLKPDTPYNLTIVFCPTVLGPHHNSLIMETNQGDFRRKILLNGVGGIPSLTVRNIKIDLSGNKYFRLSNLANDMFYTNDLEVRNEGKAAGFVLIKSNSDVLALSRELTICPDRLVIQPNSTVSIKITQKLKREDLNFLFSGKDICKIATLSVFMGCEYNRLRTRKLIENGVVPFSTNMKLLTSTFHKEIDLDLKNFKDTPTFEKQFLKDTKIINVAVVLERPSSGDPTIIEGADETAIQFVTVVSAPEIKPTRNAQNTAKVQKSKSKADSEADTVQLSPDSVFAHRKVAKWLENLNPPPRKH